MPCFGINSWVSDYTYPCTFLSPSLDPFLRPFLAVHWKVSTRLVSRPGGYLGVGIV